MKTEKWLNKKIEQGELGADGKTRSSEIRRNGYRVYSTESVHVRNSEFFNIGTFTELFNC
jgi:hypothetical protein